MTAPRLVVFFNMPHGGWAVHIPVDGTSAFPVSKPMVHEREANALCAKWQRFLDAGLEPLDWIKPKRSVAGSA